jgi:hypothetical protein
MFSVKGTGAITIRITFKGTELGAYKWNCVARVKHI